MEIVIIGDVSSVRHALIEHSKAHVVIVEKKDPLIELTHMLFTKSPEPPKFYPGKKDRNRNDHPRNAFRKGRGHGR